MSKVIGELVDGQVLSDGHFVVECDGESLVVEATDAKDAATTVARHLDTTGNPAYRAVVRTDEGPAEYIVERESKYTAILLGYCRKVEA